MLITANRKQYGYNCSFTIYLIIYIRNNNIQDNFAASLNTDMFD